MVVVQCGPELSGHRVAPDRASHWRTTAAAGADRPARLDQRHVPPGPDRKTKPAGGPPEVGEQQIGLAADPLASRSVDLVAISEPVDQPDREGLGSGPRARVDQLADPLPSQ